MYSCSTLLWYWCYYPHRLRDSRFPVCGIFTNCVVLSHKCPKQRWKKTYERASNACVKNFLAWVKSVPHVTVLCRKNKLQCNFALVSIFILALNDNLCRLIVILALFWVKLFGHKPCSCNFFLYFYMSGPKLS